MKPTPTLSLVPHAADSQRPESAAPDAHDSVLAAAEASYLQLFVREATGLVEGRLEPLHLELWQYGALSDQIRNFEALQITPGTAQARGPDEWHEGSRLATARRQSAEATRVQAVQALFGALGIDRRGGEGLLTPSSVICAFSQLQGGDHARTLEWWGLAAFASDVGPIVWASQCVARFGLTLEPVSPPLSSGEPAFRIKMGIARNDAGEITAPGWRCMAECATRRRALRARCLLT